MKIVVVSDTHVPDRAASLHPALLGELQRSKPDLILHAGDISTPGVLKALGRIAPVKAVMGNRDWLFAGKLKGFLELNIHGVNIALTHGHLNFLTYWWDKANYMFRGYNRDRIVRRLELAFPKADLVVFGHTHRAENYRQNGKLFFNPGSATIGDIWVHTRSYGILEIGEDHSVQSRIIPLAGFHLVNRQWEAQDDQT